MKWFADEMRRVSTLTAGSILSGLYDPSLHAPWYQRLPRLWFMSFLFGLVGVYVCFVLGLDQAGFISLFFLATSLSDAFNEILRENREEIFQQGIPVRYANAKTASSVLAIFLGIVVVYVIAAVYWGRTGAEANFGFVLDAAGLQGDTLLSRRFDSFTGLLSHNFLVLTAVWLLAFVYRSFGALLALTWNACIWGFVLTVLVWRGMDVSDTSVVAFVAIALAELLPHLALEGFAYVLAALAAIYLSRALFKYGLGHPITRRVTRTSFNHLLLGAVSLFLAAVVESGYAPRVLDLLR